MRHSNVLVLGGSGFIGRYVVNFLVARGCRVLVPSRRRDRARHLILLPTCDVVDANIMDDAILARLVAGQDAVINLVGILHGTEADFQRVHADLPRRVVAACAKHRVGRLLHMSALGASASAPSMYLRSKGAGEAQVQASALPWTLFRPSTVFGVEDRFLNLFGRLAAWFPVLPIGGLPYILRRDGSECRAAWTVDRFPPKEQSQAQAIGNAAFPPVKPFSVGGERPPSITDCRERQSHSPANRDANSELTPLNPLSAAGRRAGGQ